MQYTKSKREPALLEALIPIIVTFILIICTETLLIIKLKSILLPFAVGIVMTMTIGVLHLGYSIKDILLYIVDIIKELRKVLLAIIIISMLMGAWTISGILPTFIYYGVQTISPAFCLVAICLICSGASFITGSS